MGAVKEHAASGCHQRTCQSANRLSSATLMDPRVGPGRHSSCNLPRRPECWSASAFTVGSICSGPHPESVIVVQSRLSGSERTLEWSSPITQRRQRPPQQQLTSHEAGQGRFLITSDESLQAASPARHLTHYLFHTNLSSHRRGMARIQDGHIRSYLYSAGAKYKKKSPRKPNRSPVALPPSAR